MARELQVAEDGVFSLEDEQAERAAFLRCVPSPRACAFSVGAHSGAQAACA
jgi:hypothetical protein